RQLHQLLKWILLLFCVEIARQRSRVENHHAGCVRAASKCALQTARDPFSRHSDVRVCPPRASFFVPAETSSVFCQRGLGQTSLFWHQDSIEQRYHIPGLSCLSWFGRGVSCENLVCT